VTRRLRLLVLAAFLVGGCSGGAPSAEPASTDAPADSGGLHVVVTTTILGDVVRDLVGDVGDVQVLMQPGQDPHAFQPSAQQAQRLRSADLVVANGLDLEEPLLDLLAAVEADGVPVLRVGEYVDPLLAGEDADDHDDHADEDDHGHDHGPEDPHFWQDPLRMATAVEVLADHLAGITGADDWHERGAALAADLRAVHEEVADRLADIPADRRVLVTSHDNLAYFAARYDLEVVGTVIPGTSTQAAASAAGFAELAGLVRELGVPAIFAETTRATDLAEALAEEVGRDVAVVTLYTDALGPPGSGADTYVGMLRTNAARIADALG
jgi:zinc/manganese transport system substrate-binding protein